MRSTLLVVCCLAVQAPFLAGATVAIDGERPRERVTVSIQDEGLGAALRELGRTYDFEVKGAFADGTAAVSTTLSGRLDDVLARLLRNVDHVIVRSPDNRSGIAKVILMGRGRARQPGASPALTDDARSNPERPPYSSTEDRD
jgi:hypothetical protein